MICFECSKKYAKPKDNGCHTTTMQWCNYCGKGKYCFQDRHFVIDEKLVADKSNKPTESKMKTSTDILKECVGVQAERGAEYDADETQERSFKQASVAFNAITKKDITPAEVCLMLQVLKDVRQWSHPDRLHEDSVLDGVSYASLKAEELNKQFSTQSTFNSVKAGIGNHEITGKAISDYTIQNDLFLFDPANGSKINGDSPRNADWYRQFHGNLAWLFNPWNGKQRSLYDVASDPLGVAIAR